MQTDTVPASCAECRQAGLQQQQLLHREVCLWLFLLRCCAAAAAATPAPLFPRAHMSNTSPHTCPCITIWLLNPHQRFLEALFSLSLTSCLWRAFFSVLHLHFLYFFIPFFFCPTSLAFFLSSSLLSPSLRQCDVCRDRAPGTLWVMPDVRCGIRRLVKPRRSPPSLDFFRSE